MMKITLKLYIVVSKCNYKMLFSPHVIPAYSRCVLQYKNQKQKVCQNIYDPLSAFAEAFPPHVWKPKPHTFWIIPARPSNIET